MSHANLGRDLLDRAAELLAEHGTVERPPLLEGRNMYIVMAPLEKRAEKKTDDAAGEERPAGAATEAAEPEAPANGETIGDAVAAKGAAPAKGGAPTAIVEPPAAEESQQPAEQG